VAATGAPDPERTIGGEVLTYLCAAAEEAGDKSLAFSRLPPRQSESTRAAKGIERRDEAFERRIKTQIVLRPRSPRCCSERCSRGARADKEARRLATFASPSSISPLRSPPDRITSAPGAAHHGHGETRAYPMSIKGRAAKGP